MARFRGRREMALSCYGLRLDHLRREGARREFGAIAAVGLRGVQSQVGASQKVVELFVLGPARDPRGKAPRARA